MLFNDIHDNSLYSVAYLHLVVRNFYSILFNSFLESSMFGNIIFIVKYKELF